MRTGRTGSNRPTSKPLRSFAKSTSAWRASPCTRLVSNEFSLSQGCFVGTEGLQSCFDPSIAHTETPGWPGVFRCLWRACNIRAIAPRRSRQWTASSPLGSAWDTNRDGRAARCGGRVRKAWGGYRYVSFDNVGELIEALATHGWRDLLLVVGGGALSTAASSLSIWAT